MLVFAAVGIAPAGTILQGMTDTMCSLEILVGDLNIFMTDLAGAIKSVADNGVGLLDKVATQVDITSDLQLQVDHTVGNMSSLILWLSNKTYERRTRRRAVDKAQADRARRGVAKAMAGKAF